MPTTRATPTPGPWKQNMLLVTDARGATVAHCTRWEGATPRPEISEANARLIAAAPDLLEALRFFLVRYTGLVNSGDCGDWNPEADEEVKMARAAIAKAEGA